MNGGDGYGARGDADFTACGVEGGLRAKGTVFLVEAAREVRNPPGRLAGGGS